MTRQLSKKQTGLNLVNHKLIQDEKMRWGSAYDIVERFVEQQEAMCAVLAENLKKVAQGY